MIDLLKTRRSIRRFTEKEVEQDKLELLLKGALMSPSSKSRRPWEFIAVTNKELLNELSKCKEHGSSFLNGAPLGIVVVADPEACDVWIEDCSIASTIIQLTAQSIGLGSCWIQIRERLTSHGQNSEDYVKKVLNIPEKYNVLAIIALGYPGEEKSPQNEEKLEFNKLHYNKF